MISSRLHQVSRSLKDCRVSVGAGTIIVNKGHIKGLTTAAGLWASACIGLAIGTGFYKGAIVGTAAVYITERVLHDFSKGIRRKHGAYDDTDKSDNQQQP